MNIGLLGKRFEEPDETRRGQNCVGEIVTLGEVYVGRYTFAPGWVWSKDVKPVVGTPSCRDHHQGYVVSGRTEVLMDDGARRIFGPGEVINIPPGHDARTIGDEPCVMILFTGVRDYGIPRQGEARVLSTLLMTDIVGSTALATKLGDAKWKDLLGRHSDRVRRELDRFRGHEIVTTGDGFLAMFDGTARAVRCAEAMCRAARVDEIAIRAGVHTGEVEWHANNLRGMAVHVVARVSSLAGADEVLVSATTAGMLEGSGIQLSDAGEHELKGVEGRRRIYRVTGV